jgi:hypothetical protein
MIGDGDSDGDSDGDGGDDVVVDDKKEDEDEEEESGAIRRNQCAGLPTLHERVRGWPLSMTYAWLQVKSGKKCF